jgi:hypothetical protein
MDAFILPQGGGSEAETDTKELVPPGSPASPIPSSCLKFPRRFRVHPHETGSGGIIVCPDTPNPSNAFRRQSSQNASRRSCISLLEGGSGLNFNSLRKNRNKVSCVANSDVASEDIGISRFMTSSPSVGDISRNSVRHFNDSVRRIAIARSSPQLTNCDQISSSTNHANSSSTRNTNFFSINNNNQNGISSNNNGEIGGNEPNSTRNTGHNHNVGGTINSNGGFKKFLILSTTILYVILVICIPPGSCEAPGDPMSGQSGRFTTRSLRNKELIQVSEMKFHKNCYTFV